MSAKRTLLKTEVESSSIRIMLRSHSHTSHINSRQKKKKAFYSKQVGKLVGTSFPVILPSFLKAFPFREQ